MKKAKFNLAMLIGISAIAMYFSACQKNEVTPVSPSSPGAVGLKNQNSLVFPASAHMYGKSYAEWSTEWWKWVFQFDCAHVPTLDASGANQSINQSGQVFFLGGSSGGPAVIRNVTVPAGKALFFPLVNYYANYPCSGEPAQGESMEHFLAGQVNDIIPYMDQLSLTVDGVSVDNLTNYLCITSLFNYTGNPDLTNCIDSCINGQEQPAVNGGYHIMLKPLEAGSHVIHFTGGASAFGFLVDITYNITQQ